MSFSSMPTSKSQSHELFTNARDHARVRSVNMIGMIHA